MTVSWEPELYACFEAERTQPCADLILRLPLAHPRRIMDLGCGPGNSTELLARRFPSAELRALDSSEEMLNAARKRVRGCSFVRADMAEWSPPERYDLLFANASLHWLPDPVAAMERLAAFLNPGGVLAAQMPRSFHLPTHVSAREIAEMPRWSSVLKTIENRSEPPAPGADYDVLKLSNSNVQVWETVYEHILPSPAHVVQWMRGTGLRPYLDRLSVAERQNFLTEYALRIHAEYPPDSSGKVVLKYPRVFILIER